MFPFGSPRPTSSATMATRFYTLLATDPNFKIPAADDGL